MKRIAVVRVRGRVGVREKVEDTLEKLKLTRVNHCVIVDDSPQKMGMVEKCSNYVTWGEIDAPTFALMVKKRGRIGRKRVDEEEMKKSGFESFEKFAEKFCSFECELEAVGIKEVFRLHPPRGGHRHIKKPYPEGALGYRGEKINELLRRMV
ncbi:MAG: 50S ribosomal protein L30 [Candidatus Micrarchaeia archaeon]